MYIYGHYMQWQTPREGSRPLSTRNIGQTDNIYTGIHTYRYGWAGGEGKTIGRREIFALGIFNGQLNAYDKNV